MKILHLVEAFGGGVYFFLRDLLNHPALSEFDIEVLYSPRGDFEKGQLERDFPRVKFTLWPSAQREIRPLKDFRALLEARKFIRKTRPDFIHCHSSKAGVLGRAIAFSMGQQGRLAYSPHGLSFLKLDDPPWKRKLYRRIERLFSKLGGTVVGCSPSEVKALAESGIPARLIQNGVAAPKAVPDRRFAPPFKIITVGRVTVPKHPALFNEIALAMPDLSFVWVGDGELREQLTAENIRVTGWISREEIASILSEAHVYLSTSLWEGLPLAVLEGMAEGMPLLLSRCVGNVDLVDGNNGRLFSGKAEAVHQLREMLADPAKLKEMGTASAKLLREGFSVDAMAAAYRDLYLSKR